MEGTGKLVRDRIPDLITADGDQPHTRVAHGEEYPALLRLKLLEEVQEFLDSGNADELVDVVEVVYALAREKGMKPEKLEELRVAKKRERGDFSQQTVLIGTTQQTPPHGTDRSTGPHRSARPHPPTSANGPGADGSEGADGSKGAGRSAGADRSTGADGRAGRDRPGGAGATGSSKVDTAS